MDAWQELDELLAEPPSPLAFRALGALLDRWTAPDREAALRAAERGLEAWPDAARVAPWSWVVALSQGKTKPTWRLVRAVELRSAHAGRTRVPFAAIAGAPELAGLTRFELCRADDADAFIQRAERWERIESLAIASTRVDTVLPRGARLRELTIRADDLVELSGHTSLPELRALTVFVRDQESARALARCPELRALESLTLLFRGAEGDAAAESFFGSARLDRLTSLTLCGRRSDHFAREGNGARTIEALIRAGLCQRLARLRLEHLPLGDDGLVPLAPELGAELRSLELVDVHAGDRAALALARSSALPGLTRLDLSANRIGARGSENLADRGYTRLSELDLSGPACHPHYFSVGEQPLGDAGFHGWTASPALHTLRALSARATRLTDASLEALANPRAAALRALDLSHNQFTATGTSALVRAPFWPALRSLALNDCLLDDAAVAALTLVRRAPALRTLGLAYNVLRPAGAAALAAWPLLERVWQLDLHDSVLTSAVLTQLAASPHLTRLLELDLEQGSWNCDAATFDDAAAQALARNAALGRLDAIFAGIVDERRSAVYQPGFSEAARQVLANSPGLRPEVGAMLDAGAVR